MKREWDKSTPARRVLLTGASGFLGRNALRALLDDGHIVLAPVRDRAALNDFSACERLIVLEENFYDESALKEYAHFGPDIIIHLAAIRGEGNGGWKTYQQVNVDGTERLVQFALEQPPQRFVYCSTVGIYGTVPSRLPADPWTAAVPDGNYHRSKFQAERLVLQNLRNVLPFTILRPTITYGPGDDGFIPRLVSMVRRRLFPMIRSDAMIHLLDVHAFAELVRRTVMRELPEECVVNVADRAPVHLSRIVDEIHGHFYGEGYPELLKTPPVLHQVGEAFASWFNIMGWHNSVRLISNSWYYDTSQLRQVFDLPLPDTLTSIRSYLGKTFPQNGNGTGE